MKQQLLEQHQRNALAVMRQALAASLRDEPVMSRTLILRAIHLLEEIV